MKINFPFKKLSTKKRHILVKQNNRLQGVALLLFILFFLLCLRVAFNAEAQASNIRYIGIKPNATAVALKPAPQGLIDHIRKHNG